MYPHERSLVKNLKGKPFALIGVNSDPKDKVKAALKRENITWRSFWDGGRTGGPIASKYQVRGWPTVYMIDHQGIIRYKNPRGPAIDTAIKDLLAKVDGSTGGAVGSTVGGPVAKMREFVDSTGQFKIRAKFVGFKSGKAFLEKEGGEVIGLSMTKLSAADQRYIRELLRNK